MNERFERLAEEAMVHVPGQTGLHTRVFSLEKFAELVVKECADLVLGPEPVYVGDYSKWAIAQLIKQHFGVEE